MLVAIARGKQDETKIAVKQVHSAAVTLHYQLALAPDLVEETTRSHH